MTEANKTLKQAIRNEINPLLIGLRADIKDLTSLIAKGTMLPELSLSEETVAQIKDFKQSITPQKGVDFFDGYTPVKGKDYSDGYTPIKGTDYFTEKEIKKYLKATTPKKGKDYFTKEDITAFKKSVTPKKGKDYSDGYTPVKGKDYFTTKEAKEFLKSATPIKGVHYKDGENGKPGKDGAKISAEEIRNKLESLTGKQKLKMSAVLDLKETIEALVVAASVKGTRAGGSGGGGGLTNFLLSGNIIVGSSANVATPRALSGDATLSNTGVLTLASIVSANAIGSASQVPVFSYDAKGRITAGTQTSISISYSQVSDFFSGVDIWSYQFPFKQECRVATTEYVDLNSVSTIDHIDLNPNDRVLVLYQTDATENGIYVYNENRLFRAEDAGESMMDGVFVTVMEGALWGASAWHLSLKLSATSAGSTSFTFTKVWSDKNQFKDPCACATTANVDLSDAGDLLNGSTVDGYTLAVGDRVLVKDQGTALENGIYIVTSSSPQRTHDVNVNTEILGCEVKVLYGSTYAMTYWHVTSFAGVIDTDDMIWAQISSGGGSGITSLGGQTGATQTFSKTDDTNVTLAITSSADNHAFTLGWTGRLAYSRLTQGSALSVLGVAGNATADVASITAGSDGAVLRRSGTTLGFGAINLASSNAVTGITPIANGGTNNDASGFTTAGALVMYNGTKLIQRNFGSSNTFLGMDPTATFFENKVITVGSTGTAPNVTYGPTTTIHIPLANVSVTSGTISNASQNISGSKSFLATAIFAQTTGASVLEGVRLSPSGAASSGVPVYYSTDLNIRSHVWNTTGAGSAETQDWRFRSIPTSNTAPTSILGIYHRNNAGTETQVASFDSASPSWRLSIKAGTSSGLLAKVGGTLYTNTTQVQNGTTVETDLHTQAIAANIMAVDGAGIHFVYAGTIATSLNNKTLKVKWGGTTIFDSTAQNPAVASNFIIEGWIIRTGATTQKCFAKLNITGGSLYTFTGYAAGAETLSGAVTLKLTGQGGASNEIACEASVISYNAPTT